MTASSDSVRVSRDVNKYLTSDLTALYYLPYIYMYIIRLELSGRLAMIDTYLAVSYICNSRVRLVSLADNELAERNNGVSLILYVAAFGGNGRLALSPKYFDLLLLLPDCLAWRPSLSVIISRVAYRSR